MARREQPVPATRAPVSGRRAARRRPGGAATVLATVLLVAWSAPALAGEAWRVRLDADASSVRFSLGATLHTVEGTALWAAGPQEVSVDLDTGAASGRLVIDAASLETGNARRDRKMHAEVLESEAFPEIVFELRAVTGLPEVGGRATVEMAGDLELHGDSHPMSIPVDVAIDGATVTGSAAFEIPYVAWGLDDPSRAFLRVEKVVEVVVELSGSVE